jgi:chromate transporter
VLAGVSAGLLVFLPQTGAQVAVIAAGALIGWAFLKHGEAGPSPAWAQQDCVPTKKRGTILLILFFVLLAGLPALVCVTNNPPVEVADKFYRAGALVFGGGHVVLPLLEREVVAPGWVTHDQFLAGYGAAQAVPGPLFTFSAYLGAVMNHGPRGWLGGVWALAGIFLPALLLVAGALPFWQTLRHQPAAQAALRGANAAVVGVLLAALYRPVGTGGLVDGRSTALAVAAFVALQSARVPVWAVVGAAAGAGALLWH